MKGERCRASLLSEQPALGLLCTICGTEGTWGKDGVWRCGTEVQHPTALGDESRGQRCCPALRTKISCFSLPLLWFSIQQQGAGSCDAGKETLLRLGRSASLAGLQDWLILCFLSHLLVPGTVTWRAQDKRSHVGHSKEISSHINVVVTGSSGRGMQGILDVCDAQPVG